MSEEKLIPFIVYNNGTKMSIQAKPSAKFSEILEKICSQLKLNPSNIRFHHGDKVIGNMKETLESYGLQAGDSLELMSEQLGG